MRFNHVLKAQKRAWALTVSAALNQVRERVMAWGYG